MGSTQVTAASRSCSRPTSRRRSTGSAPTKRAFGPKRDHLLALFSNVPDPAIAYDYVDGEPIVHRVNDAFEETFAYDADRVVGESVDDYIVPPATRPKPRPWNSTSGFSAAKTSDAR